MVKRKQLLAIQRTTGTQDTTKRNDRLPTTNEHKSKCFITKISEHCDNYDSIG